MDFDWCKNSDVGLPKPDLVIYLNVDIENASKRLEYGEEKYETKEFQKKVSYSFDQLLSIYDCEIVDGNRSIDEIHNECCELFTKTLNRCQYRKISSLFRF